MFGLNFSKRDMSALGHKRTFCDAEAMSALPPKADIRLSSLRTAGRTSLLLPIIATYRSQLSETRLRRAALASARSNIFTE